MAENNEPAANADDKPSEEKIPSQRRIFGTKRIVTPAASAAPELEEKLANLVDSVKVLQSHIGGGKPIGEPAGEVEQKGRRLKRFQRAGSDENVVPDGESVPDDEVRGDETTLNKNIAWPRLARMEEDAPPSSGERAAAYVRRHPIILWLLAQAGGLGLLLLGFWGGQSIANDENTDRPNQPESASTTKTLSGDLLARVGINDRALDAAGQGLHAEKTGDLNAAQETWEGAVAGRVQLPGAEYRLAMLAIQRNDLSVADIHLSNSLAAGEMMASCYYVNSCLAGKKSNYPYAAKQLASAVKIEPFNAKYLFCLGEALRRAGKPLEGIGAITQALDRPASSEDVGLFTFKRNLAKVEAGHDGAFDAELAGHLARTPADGDWLLLAAAQDLGRSAFPAAAGHLKDAARALPPERYALLVQDFAFQSYAQHTEVTALLNVPPPAASQAPLDPGAWPAEEADPGVWPPFSPVL